MVPLMMMRILGFLKGVPGLFMAGILSAALSSLSSIYHALSATLTRDVVQQAYEFVYKKPIPERMETLSGKIISESVSCRLQQY